MIKTRILCCLLCVLMMISQVCVFAQDDSSVSSGSHSVNASVSLSESKKLLETSKAVALYELNSDTLVYGWNIDEKVYPSSMVKLMTAIVALENGTLTDTVTVTKSALSHVAIGAVSANLKNGEQLSLESLLYCMMCQSANDAAVVIAEHIGGSQEGFLQLMNEKAKDIGCTGTNYTNVHGLHDEQTYTTTRDICKILEYGLKNPQFKMLFTAKTYTVPATNKSEARNIQTSNYMMSKDYTSKYFDERVTGGKTGATDKAGRCLAVTAEANGMNLLGIVMGATPTYEEEGIILKTYGSFEEMKKLLDFGCNGFEYRQIFFENQTIAQYAVADGVNDVVTKPVSQLSTVLPVDLDESKLRWEYDDAPDLSAPIKAGQHISNVRVWYGNICLAQTGLVAVNDVSVFKPTTDTPSEVTEGPDVWIIIGVVIGGIVLIILILRFLRIFAVSRAKARRKRRRQQRRMEW